MKKHLLHFCLSAACLAVLFVISAHAADPEPPKAADTKLTEAKPLDRAALEKQFEEMLSGVTLVGHYTSGKQDTPSVKEDKYTIDKVSKLEGDTWLFQVRIQYGGHDVALPLPLTVLWAGSTPMITLDNMNVPGLGAFSARVVFHEGKYAGTWSGHNHGGVLFGTIEKVVADTDKEKKE